MDSGDSKDYSRLNDFSSILQYIRLGTPCNCGRKLQDGLFSASDRLTLRPDDALQIRLLSLIRLLLFRGSATVSAP